MVGLVDRLECRNRLWTRVFSCICSGWVRMEFGLVLDLDTRIVMVVGIRRFWIYNSGDRWWDWFILGYSSGA